MFRKGLCEYQNVVDIHTHGAVHDEVLKNVIHHHLKGRQTVHEAEIMNTGTRRKHGCVRIGSNPNNVSAELSDLSYAEKLLIAKICTNYCMMRLESGYHKMHAKAVLIPNPVPKIYHKLPTHNYEMDDVLSFVYTGPLPPEKLDLQCTPFLVRRHKVTNALRWLNVNHCNYTNIEISEENALSYEEGEPPMTIEYHK